jgi:hypothetical protein
VEHITSVCPVFAREQFIKRHDRVFAQLYCKICKEIGVILNNGHWHVHVLKSVETSHEGKSAILWKQQVQTNRTIPNNKPDIIHDNKQETCMFIDVANPGDRNVIKKEAEKILKYKVFILEIQHMWNVKAKVLPVIIGATGTISESLGHYLNNIPGKHEIKELQKITLLGTAHVLWTVVM